MIGVGRDVRAVFGRLIEKPSLRLPGTHPPSGYVLRLRNLERLFDRPRHLAVQRQNLIDIGQLDPGFSHFGGNRDDRDDVLPIGGILAAAASRPIATRFPGVRKSNMNPGMSEVMVFVI